VRQPAGEAEAEPGWKHIGIATGLATLVTLASYAGRNFETELAVP
jgi:hypothetical protein